MKIRFIALLSACLLLSGCGKQSEPLPDNIVVMQNGSTCWRQYEKQDVARSNNAEYWYDIVEYSKTSETLSILYRQTYHYLPPEQQDTTMAAPVPESWIITDWTDVYDITSAAFYNQTEYEKDGTSKLTVTISGAKLISSDMVSYYKE